MGLALAAGAAAAQTSPPPLPAVWQPPATDLRPVQPLPGSAGSPASGVPIMTFQFHKSADGAAPAASPAATARPAQFAPSRPADLVRPASTGPELIQAAFQVPGRDSDSDASDLLEDYQIQLQPPGPGRLFQLDSPRSLYERVRQEYRDRQDRIQLPEEPPSRVGTFQARVFPARTMLAEPNYVCHKRLLFEQRNFERGGWDFGVFQPFLSTGLFYADVVTLPYHLATNPLCCYDSSAGKCLPGDPTPLLLYPPPLSLTGSLAEAGAIVALVAIFP